MNGEPTPQFPQTSSPLGGARWLAPRPRRNPEGNDMNLNDLKSDDFATNNVLRALTCSHLYSEIEKSLRALKIVAKRHVTHPGGEAGLTDFDVPPAQALARLLDQARELYVNGPDVEANESYHEVVDYDLVFHEGLVRALRTMADHADELRVRALHIADLVAETYQDTKAEETLCTECGGENGVHLPTYGLYPEYGDSNALMCSRATTQEGE